MHVFHNQKRILVLTLAVPFCRMVSLLFQSIKKRFNEHGEVRQRYYAKFLY